VKILFTVHHFLDVNAGAAGATLDLASQYSQMGHSVEVYSFDDLPLPAAISGRERQLVFPYFVAAHLAKRLAGRDVDVVDASSGDAWLVSLLRRRRGLRLRPLLVTRSHGVEHRLHHELVEDADRGNLQLSWKYPLYHGGWRLREVATSFRHSDVNIVLNSADERYLINGLRVDPSRVRLIPHGILDSLIGLPLNPMPSGGPSIAYIGRRDFRKGYGFFAEALSRLLVRYPDLKVGFFGSLCEAEVIVSDYDATVRGQIQVVPQYRRSELPTLLADYQIMVFPTLGEGFGLALVEAMSCGLAPVVTAVPGPIDIVKDGYDAIVIPPRDARAIARAVEALINDLPRLDVLRRNAQMTAQAFRWRAVAERTLDVYREFLEPHDGQESKEPEDSRGTAATLRAG
jgi:glycosyltransferase involved in cell wall biosynthesis